MMLHAFLRLFTCSSISDSWIQKGYKVFLGKSKSVSGIFQGYFKSAQKVLIAFQAG